MGGLTQTPRPSSRLRAPPASGSCGQVDTLRRCDDTLKVFRKPGTALAVETADLSGRSGFRARGVSSYDAWLDAPGYDDAYRFHARLFRHLQGPGEAPRRWILKSPDLLFSADALARVFPTPG